jgi:hypothetical protein
MRAFVLMRIEGNEWLDLFFCLVASYTNARYAFDAMIQTSNCPTELWKWRDLILLLYTVRCKGELLTVHTDRSTVLRCIAKITDGSDTSDRYSRGQVDDTPQKEHGNGGVYGTVGTVRYVLTC